jgi:DNA-binding SARP family transcriptional activator
VVAPPGSGKSTLLAQFAAGAGVPVAWYRAEASDADAGVLLAGLERATRAAFTPLPDASWASPEAAAHALETWPQPRGLLVVDDLHLFFGTEAEAALERLVDYLPPSVTVLTASRRVPGFDLSRLRVAGSLFELGPDDLRFRSWEVETLFNEFYGEPLPPEDLAELARRTEGWAAGLQLFHLATKGKPPGERRRVLAGLRSASRLVREYLANNVLGDLPEDLRHFLVRTSVLGRLTGPLCDQVMGRRGSREVLEDLERRQIFTNAIDDDTFRYHEVLRTHLEATLVEEHGEVAASALYRRAGGLLEAAGAPPDALRAYCRAGDWAAAGRLLGREGEQLAGDPGAWVEHLPPALGAETDPWLNLARARRYLAAGRFHPARDAYLRAEQAFGSSAPAETCRRERLAVTEWLDPGSAPGTGWVHLARAAVRRQPLAALDRAVRHGGVEAGAVQGLAACLAGRVRAGRRLLESAAEAAGDGVLATGAHLAAAVAGACFLGDEATDDDLDWVVDEAERLGLPWLTRMARAITAVLIDGPASEAAEALRRAAEDEGDLWATGIISLAQGLSGLLRGPASASATEAALHAAADAFSHLDAATLEVWARAALALVNADGHRADARQASREAEAMARSTGVPGALALAYLARSVAEPERAAELGTMARSVDLDAGLGVPGLAGVLSRADSLPGPGPNGAGMALPVTANGPATPAGNRDRRMQLRCLGGFALTVDGHPVDLAAVRPRARAALRLLAMRADRAVHRETIIEALWPEIDAGTGAHNLQVVISALRRLLEPDAPRGASSLLVREGDAYRLALPPGADVDVLAFEVAAADARAARSAGDVQAAVTALERAQAVYAGELLPEDGPAEWAVKERERLRLVAAEMAQIRAEVALELDDTETAAAACEWGLAVDRYHDRLWRLLAEARERSGDHAAAHRARRAYDDALAELGLPVRGDTMKTEITAGRIR